MLEEEAGLWDSGLQWQGKEAQGCIGEGVPGFARIFMRGVAQNSDLSGDLAIGVQTVSQIFNRLITAEYHIRF